MITDGRHWWRMLLVQGILISGCALLLMVGYDIAVIFDSNEGRAFTSGTGHSLIELNTLRYLWHITASQLHLIDGLVLLFFIITGSVLTLYHLPREKQVVWFGTGILAIILSSFPASFLAFEHLAGRYVSPSYGIWLLLVVLSTVLLLKTLMPSRRSLQNSVLVLIAGIWLYQPFLTRTQELIQSTWPQTRQHLVQHVEAALPAGTIAIPDDENPFVPYWTYFDPVWGNYSGALRPVVSLDDYTDRPYARWLDNHIRFAVLTGESPGTKPELSFDPARLFLLASFPPPDADRPWSGKPYYLYQTTAPDVLLETSSDEALQLTGYDYHLTDDNQLLITPYWQSNTTLSVDYHFFVHITRTPDAPPVAQADLPLSRQASSAWQYPSAVYTGNTAQISLTADILTTSYTVAIGVYNPATGQRLSLNRADNETLSLFTLDALNAAMSPAQAN
jgi:hypothetical protein